MTGCCLAVVGVSTAGRTAAPERPAQRVEIQLRMRASQPGGKLRGVTNGSVAMEAAPTVFTTGWAVEAGFEAVAARLTDQSSIEACRGQRG
jgi:hypothetical protein